MEYMIVRSQEPYFWKNGSWVRSPWASTFFKNKNEALSVFREMYDGACDVFEVETIRRRWNQGDGSSFASFIKMHFKFV
jgi:hypothetical protein